MHEITMSIWTNLECYVTWFSVQIWLYGSLWNFDMYDLFLSIWVSMATFGE